MKQKLILFCLVLATAAAVALMAGCRKTDAYRGTVVPFVTPPGFPAPVYNFAANPVTEQGFQLGKQLFYEGQLSKDGNYACASCHQPVAAFTTYEHDRSHGYNNSHTLRNAPALFNLAWQTKFNHDGSAASLADVYRAHITNPTEMAETIPGVLNKLKANSRYPPLFSAAFGSAAITEERMYSALSQFVLSLVSAGSRYDKALAGSATLTDTEQSGGATFAAKCATCHAGPLFTDFSYRNTGFPADDFLKDYGLMRVTGQRTDSLKFRVPSLRNAEFTSYYGHDGRLSFFRHLIQHYRNPTAGPTLDPLLTTGIPLTTTEENNLVAFIRTLSDSAFLANPRYR